METKERKMRMAKVSMSGRMMTKTHLRRSRLLFKLSWTPLTTPLLSSATLSWRIWLIVRSTIHSPNLARIIPRRNTDTELYFWTTSSNVKLETSMTGSSTPVLFVESANRYLSLIGRFLNDVIHLLEPVMKKLRSIGDPGKKQEMTASELVDIRRNIPIRPVLSIPTRALIGG